MNEEVKQILEAVASLGETGAYVFVAWVMVGYLKTLTTATAWVIIFIFLIRRIGAALFNLAKAKNNG